MHRRIGPVVSSSMMASMLRVSEQRFWNLMCAIGTTIQGDVFSRAIREGTELAVPLEGSSANMAVIEAVFRSARSGNWEKPEKRNHHC